MIHPLAGALGLVIAVVCAYAVRHYLFTLNRLFGTQRHPYIDVQFGPWPDITVLVPARNEEKVITHALDALLASTYPADCVQIIPINDRSTDRTAEILDDYARRFPKRVQPFHRREGIAGKAAALRDATEYATGTVILVFDADYIPGRNLLEQLVAPFFDPQVGAVMGRVVPLNVGRSLLTRLLDLERTGGYQVDQQARMNLRLVPQFGGTVGGVRRSALESVGGWRTDTLTEDTDLTYRLLLDGWETVYQNRSECYEEVPEEWSVRVRQIRRWATGHNECLWRYSWRLLRHARTESALQRIDGLMLLGVYAVAPLLVIGWALALFLFYVGYSVAAAVLLVLSITSYYTLGNFAAFYEVAVAARLDGYRNRIRLLPFLVAGFLVSLVSVTRSVVPKSLFRNRELVWDKTVRYRAEDHDSR